MGPTPRSSGPPNGGSVVLLGWHWRAPFVGRLPQTLGMTVREFELLTISVIHQNVAPIVEAHLRIRGFVSVRPLLWVRSEDSPIRQLFEYRQLKGGALAPAWGYSFDFVPHFSGREMKWHRTEKSVLFDAFVDGQVHRDLVLTYMYGVDGLLEGLDSRVANAIQIASNFWAMGDTPNNVYLLVNELRSKPGSNFFTQLPIASAFCLARSGREAEGRIELERFIQDACKYPSTELNERVVAKLWKAFEAAIASVNQTSP